SGQQVVQDGLAIARRQRIQIDQQGVARLRHKDVARGNNVQLRAGLGGQPLRPILIHLVKGQVSIPHDIPPPDCRCSVSTGCGVHERPLTTHHSPLTTHHSPLTTHHSPLLLIPCSNRRPTRQGHCESMSAPVHSR